MTDTNWRSNYKMPFGKHKGELIADIPSPYLEWCLENIEKLSENLREEMENQIRARKGEGILRKSGKEPAPFGTEFFIMQRDRQTILHGPFLSAEIAASYILIEKIEDAKVIEVPKKR